MINAKHRALQLIFSNERTKREKEKQEVREKKAFPLGCFYLLSRK